MATELVGIELELRGEEGVRRDLQELDRLLDQIGGRKQVKLAMSEAKKQIVELRGELEKLTRARDDLAKKGKTSEGLDNKIEETTRRLRDCQQATRELGYAMKELGSSTLMQNFKKISTEVKHLGQSLQTLGNTFTRIAQPFNMLMSGALLGTGYRAISTITAGLESGFSRYDTMKKYPLLMEEYATATYSAEQSVEDLDKAVRGLPTGLDEIITMSQRYTLSLGDMEKGTQLAIATNNAFLASMATESQQYQGMLQLQDLMNGKDLTSREWMSLGTSMGKAINEIGKYLGYGSDEMGKFREELYAGNIETEEFLNALIAVGTGEGKVAQLAQLSKSTWEAVGRNVKNAFSRMSAGVLESLDTISEKLTGKTLVKLFAEDWIPKIDVLTKQIRGWIEAHPEEIVDFFNSLKEIDWKGLALGFVDGVKMIFDVLKMGSDLLGGGDLRWVGKWMARLSVLGKFLTIAGGLLKGTHWIFGGIGAGGMALFGKKGGLFKWITNLFGKKKEIAEAGDVIAGAEKMAPNLGNAVKSLGTTLLKALEIGGTFAIAGGTAWILGKEFKAFFADLEEIVNTAKRIDWDMATNVMVGVGTFMGAVAVLGDILLKSGAALEVFKGTAIAGALLTFMSGFAVADTWLLKKAAGNIEEIMNSIEMAVKSIGRIQELGDISTVVGKVQNVLGGIQQIMDAFKPKYQGGANGEANGVGAFDTWVLKNKINNIVEAVRGMGDISEALKQLDTILGEVKKIGKIEVGDLGIDNIKNIITELSNAISGDALAELQVNIGVFRGTIDELYDAIDYASGNHDFSMSVKLKGGHVQGLSATTAEIKSARQKIIDAVNTLPTTITKIVNVAISANVNTTRAIEKIKQANNYVRNQARMTPVTQSRGGYTSRHGVLYRAGGGAVFKPRGTDTIPAMLSEGEYVHRKKAVDTFGVDFMRKVNNLDIRGAMQALLSRTGMGGTVNRAVTTNNTINDNRRITQNINTNNPQFAKVRAGRYAGAL